MPNDTLQIFISSPGDVGQERVIAERVIERLRGEFGGRADIEPVLWEHEPLRATEHFQEQITPPADTDIAVFILWSRLGTPLPEDKFQKESGEQYRSGTEWEFENAVEAYRESGTPDLLTYRKTKDPEARLSDKEEVQQRLEQKEALESFIERWFQGEEGTFKAAFHTFETPDEFERRLEEHLRRLVEEHLPERQTEGPSRQARWHEGSPFRGLQAFEYDHAPVFFGRTKAVGEITSALEQKESEGRPFVLVLGPSGSGKSSVVKAGVAPTITQPGVIEGIGLWRRALVRPSDAPEGPVSGLAKALLAEEAVPQVKSYGFDVEGMADLLREAPARAADPIGQALEEEAETVAEEEGLPEPPEARLLLIVDQMEELFTLDDVGTEEREAFACALRALVEDGPVWAVGTMRSDFYPRAAGVDTLHALMQGAGQYALPTPSFAEIGQMIRHPAQAAGLRFEKDPDRGIGLDEVLHEAAADNPEALPLLEFTLEELYQRRDGDVLTFEAYEALGGLEGALAERAEEVYQDLPADVRAALPDVMEALVTIRQDEDGGMEEAAASRRVPIDDVAADDARETLVDAFVEARLLVTDRNDAGEAVVSVAHEALLREWPRLRDWIERNRAFLQTRARVQERAARWAEEGQPDDLLLPTGQPLAEARGLLDEREEALGETLRLYIERSIERAERRERRRRYLVGGVAAVFFLVVAGFGLFSYQQWADAAEQRDRAFRSASYSLADDALTQLEYETDDPMTGVLLALEGLPEDFDDPDRPFVPKTYSALYQTFMQNREQWFVEAHSKPIIYAETGPKGRYLITTSQDSTARLYDLKKETVTAVLSGHGGTVYHASFDSSASRVATAGGTTARVWSVPSGDPVRTLNHEDTVLTAHLGPGGREVVTGTRNDFRKKTDRSRVSNSAHQNVHLWSVGETTRRTFMGESEEVVEITDLAISPDWSYVVAAYRDTSAENRPGGFKLWNRRTGEIQPIPVEVATESSLSDSYLMEDRYIEIVFEPHGRWVAVEMSPPRVKPRINIVKVPEGKPMSVIRGKRYEDQHVAPKIPGDGKMLLSSDDSFHVKKTVPDGVESLASWEAPVDFSRAAFVSAGTHTLSWDERKMHYMQYREGVRPYHYLKAFSGRGGPVLAGSVHPGRKQAVTVTRDVVQTWSTERIPNTTLLTNRYRYEGGSQLAVDDRYVAGITQGKVQVSGGERGEIHLYDLKQDEQMTLGGQSSEVHSSKVSRVKFSSDGTRLATADDGGTVRVWKTEADAKQAALPHAEEVSNLAFVDGNQKLLTNIPTPNSDGGPFGLPSTTRLWNLETGTEVLRIDSVRTREIRVVPGRSAFLIIRPLQWDGFSIDEPVVVEVRSAESGRVKTRIGRQTEITGVDAIGPNGEFVVCRKDSSRVVANIESGKVVAKLPNGIPDFSMNGGEIGFRGNFSRIPIFDTRSRTLSTLSDLSEKIDVPFERIGRLSFGPQGQFLASATRARRGLETPVLWKRSDTGPPYTIGRVLPNTDGVPRLRFNPEGTALAVSSVKSKRAVPIYSTRGDSTRFGREIMRLKVYDGLDTVEWVLGGNSILTRSGRGRLHLWPVYDSPQALIDSARTHATRELTDAQREEYNLVQ